VTYIDVLKKAIPDVMPALKKCLEHKDGGVRDSTMHCIGILKGRLGEGDFSKYLKDGDVNA